MRPDTDEERTEKMLRIRDAITADPLRAQTRMAWFIVGCMAFGAVIGVLMTGILAAGLLWVT